MKIKPIPLPTVMPGAEYIVDYIEKGAVCPEVFSRYGIFPGSKIKLLFDSPSKNPSAYEVMGAVLALRHEDSKNIFVLPTSLRLRQAKQLLPQLSPSFRSS